MTNIIIGILLLLTFLGFIYYIIRGGNLLLGFFGMAILWSVIGLIPFETAIQKIFAEPAIKYGPTIIYIIFGSWFGRVLVDTGIAQSISVKTQKVGKKSPLIAAILVILVTAFIFISAYGVGSVLAIGVILLPILFALGIPKQIAVAAFSMAIGSAMYVNVVLFNQIRPFFPGVEFDTNYLKFGWTAMAVQLVAVIIYLIINRRKFVPVTELEVEAEEAVEQYEHLNPLAYFIPVLPVVLNMVLHWDAIPSLILSSILAMLVTGKFHEYSRAMNFIDRTIKQSVADIAGLIMFLMALVMFSAAANMNTPRFSAVLANVVPHSTLALAIAFGVLAPLALFRGPLIVWGAGAATASVLSSLGIFDPHFLLPLLYIPSLFAVSGDITQSWNIWALDYTGVKPKTFLRNTIPIMWLVAIINELIAWAFFGR